jgi:hypothetical protein
MNITGSLTQVSTPSATQNLQSSHASRGARRDGDGDDDSAGHAQRSHGGGQVRQALIQALQSLGLTLPQRIGGNAPATATAAAAPSTTAPAGQAAPVNTATAAGQTAATDDDGDTDGSNSALKTVRHDLRQFMHALFQAVKDAASTASAAAAAPASAASATASAGAHDPKARFAAGLSALVAQIGSGSAPSELQQAFDKLVADLQPPAAAATPATTATTTPATTTPAPAPAATPASTPAATADATSGATLQALLIALQKDLGYGSTGAPATGNVISTQA